MKNRQTLILTTEELALAVYRYIVEEKKHPGGKASLTVEEETKWRKPSDWKIQIEQEV